MREAILDFYQNNQGYIKNAIAKKFPSIGDYAQDIEQDTYIKALAGADRLRSDTKVKGWLYMIAKNLAIDHIRKRARRNGILERHKEEFRTLEEHLEPDQLSRLEEAAKQLPRSQKAVYDLVRKGYSVPEIMKELKIKEATVRQRYHRLKNELARRVK